MPPTDRTTDVLIVGAGPTGLSLALSLLVRGRKFTIVDKVAEGDNTSRAAVVYPATLEELDPYGVAERLVSKGIRTPRFTIRDRDRVLTPVPFDKLHTAFPFTLLVSQAVTEATLLERFKQLGGQVLRPHTAVGIEQDDASVVVTFGDGPPMRAKIVVGADGAHSTVREQSGINSRRSNTGASYALADVHLSGGVPNNELVVYFSPAGHMVVFPLPGGIHRVVAHVDQAPEHPDVSFLQSLMDTRGPQAERATIYDIVWGSRFLTHHALADHYRVGRVVLAGDAAHEHSPLGGQGMNLGISDAAILGRVLSAILEGAPLTLLDSYNDIQRPIAEQVISITKLLTRTATMPQSFVFLRNMVVGAFSPLIRTRLARRLSLLDYFERQKSEEQIREIGRTMTKEPGKAA
ncbi:MAG: FAD-dependent monooxygenase [Candidatus Sulfotelmatobacter sp.]